MTNKTCRVGVDLGATKIRAVVYNGDYRPLARRQKKTLTHLGFDATVDRIARTIKLALDDAELSPRDVVSIGVGTPGVLDLDKGVILNAPNLGWQNAPLKEALSTIFGRNVVLGNDVDLAVYAEYERGAASGDRCVLGVFPGTGIGGGCVYEGRIMRGQHGSCMEIGHIPVLPGGPECECGAQGCLEAVASRLAIAASAAKAAHCGRAPWLRKNAGTVVSRIRSPMIAESVRNGDSAVEVIVRRSARAIGVALAGLIHTLSPNTIVLGGGLVEAMPELYVDEVELSARERVLPTFRDSFRVTTAALGSDATALGAAAWSATFEPASASAARLVASI